MTGPQCSKSKSGKPRKHTPIMSGNEADAMGIALAAKRGKVKVSELRGPALKIYQSMSQEELSSHLEEWGAKQKKAK